MLLHRSVLTMALAAGLISMTCGAGLRAADDAEKKADGGKKAVQKSADAPDSEKKEEAKDEDADRFKVPDGDVKELLAFIKESQTYRPKTREEALNFRLKGIPALREAAEKIKKIAKDEDKQLEGYDDAMGMVLYYRSQDPRASAEDRATLIQELKDELTSKESPSKYALAAANTLGRMLEHSKPEDAIALYRDFGAILVRSKNPQIAKTGASMEGAARRVGLIGNPLELTGTKMDGEKFDWASYRGKVVLVDFWATWCGPCRAEVPNVKKNYDLYHDKGFEVVGISLDDNRAALEKFLEDEKTPWLTLHDGGWNDNSVATYYGVSAIPTVILVDKEGKVVSTQARGQELGKLLEKLLGPAEPASEKSDDAATKGDDKKGDDKKDEPKK